MKGKLLYVKDDGQKVYELDYAIYMLKNNPGYDKIIERRLKNKNTKPQAFDNIPRSIWREALRRVKTI